ncbi:hypothetical protein AB8O38_06280 [Saccharomonospora xinjiangensis]|uniref:hypothetical protein n=1 Tax=Saccharomonospora xinjiangensis TaxID=75294 RepID=UPI0035109E40
MQIVNEPEAVSRLLNDRRYVVPAVCGGDEIGLEWLRGEVARFNSGIRHRRRRAAVSLILRDLDPAVLREGARLADGAQETLAVRVVASALGSAVDPDDVAVVARHYQPHTPVSEDADAAVRRLVRACGGRGDERTAALIGVFVQACEATAVLIGRCRDAVRDGARGAAEDVVAEVLRSDPPVRTTRRVSRDGTTLLLDLASADLPFGAGAHSCPGREHAIAIAAGSVERAREAR